jgi:Holliday junction resolvase RusA-like endonuclease
MWSVEEMKTIVIQGSPKSVNHTYAPGANGRRYIPAKVKAIKQSMQWQAREQWKGAPITGPVKYTMRFYFKDLLRRDIDNALKMTQDALTGIVWLDDSQVQILTAYKLLDRKNPRVEIDIEEIK